MNINIYYLRNYDFNKIRCCIRNIEFIIVIYNVDTIMSHNENHNFVIVRIYL